MTYETNGHSARLAFLFPGQGSQYVGMGRDLYQNVALVRRRLEQAGELIGIDLPALMFHGDPARLTSTELAQITVYALSTAIAEYLDEHGVRPWAVAGHSLGEYSALVTVGCLSWEEGARLVWQRGRAMALAGAEGKGAMAAIAGLPAQTVMGLCSQARDLGRVAVANYNSPQQLVVSGDEPAVLHVMELAKQTGLVKVNRLNVSGAFHSPLMEPARRHLKGALRALELAPPGVVLISGITGQPVADMDAYREDLQGQVTAPVRWSDCVATLKRLGADAYVEVGPGRVLTGLTRQFDRSAVVHTLGDLTACETFITQFGAQAV